MRTELTYRLSREFDEKGHQFVMTSSGELEFGAINTNTSLTSAPIYLSEGVIYGYGLTHIEARHGNQIRNKGYKSVIEFIEDVAKNYNVIREANLRTDNKTYLIQLVKERYNYTLIVELSEDATYWNINTAGIFRISYGAYNKVVYDSNATSILLSDIARMSIAPNNILL